MYNQKKTFDMYDKKFNLLGLLIKIWIGFVFLLVISVFCLVGYLGYQSFQFVNDPAAMGEYIGKIKSGYDSAAGE